MAGKKTGKRLLTWVLVLVMALSLLPLNALAAEADEAAALQMSDEDNSDDRSLMPTKDTYTITFDANGGTLSNGKAKFDVTYDSKNNPLDSHDAAFNNILKEAPTYPAHKFLNWYYVGLLTGIHHTVNSDTKIRNVLNYSSNNTVYAEWDLADGFEEASIFYLKDPTKRLSSNESEDWSGPLGGKKAGLVDTTGFKWTDSGILGSYGNVENSKDVQPDDVTWPSGYGTPNKDGLKLDKNTDEWNDIFEAFKTKVEADNGVGSLTEDQVDSITLVPYKVSRYNITDGSYHVDCDVVIKCNFVTVDFMVKDDSGVFGSILNGRKITCPKGEAFPENKVPTAPEKVGYEFDDWYTNEACTTKADFTTALTTDTTFYGKYTEKETPNPEPADPELGVNFKYDKDIVDVICETTDTHNNSYRLMNGYYTVSDKTQLANGNWQCKITIDLAKYFEFYNSQHLGHTRDMQHEHATAIMTISPTWYASTKKWSSAESFIDAAKIYVKCNATPTEYIPVTLTANSDTVTYDGNEKSVSGFTGAPEGADFSAITVGATGIAVGDYPAEFPRDTVGTVDKTKKYIVKECTNGTLTINPLDVTVTIKGNTGTYEYDGTEKTVEGYTLDISNNLYKASDVNLVNSQAKISATVPGTYAMGLTPGNFENTNPNFNVTFVVKPGKLTIENRPITITADDVTVKYDGQPHGENGYSITAGSLVDSHAATVIISGSETDAGKYEDWLVPSVTKIVDAENKDVTGYYDISCEDGFLTIKPRSVTLTSETASKVYDGTPLTKPEVKVTGDGFVDGEGATYNVTGTITNVGETKNTFTYTLDEGTKATNYTITKTEGKLEITPVTDEVTVTIKGNTDIKTYDGTEKTVTGYTVESISNPLYKDTDFKFTGKAEVKGTDVGNYKMGLKDSDFENKNTNFSNVKFEVTDGSLTITEAPTYTFDLTDPDIITVNKKFVSKYGRSAEKSFTATVTIEKETYTAVVDPGFPILPNVTNNRSAANVEPTYYEATGTVTLKTGKTKAFTFGEDSKFQLQPGAYRITVKETNGGDRYVTYDDATHTYDFTVNNEGEISIKMPITCTFTNMYTKRHSAATPSKPTLNTGDHYAYVMGYPDGTVRPNGSITRAEVSAILFRLLSDKTRDEYFTTESSFTDVKAGAWYNNSIATLEKAGVIVDTAKGGAFRPNEAITRAELAAMLAQFSDAKPVKGVKFSDVSAEHWAYEAIAIAAKMGWIEGYPDGTFRPDATITRAEMMTLVNRALDRVPSDEDHLLSKRVMLTFPDCKSGDWFYIAVQEATNSHTYERAATEKNGDEQWTALRANRDWTLLEK